MKFVKLIEILVKLKYKLLDVQKIKIKLDLHLLLDQTKMY